jgi:ligand-binding sensor domain-containing protein
VWFGAWDFEHGPGASRFDGKTWTRYRTDDGLADGNVHGIAFAPDGSVWFATERGASRFDGKGWTTYTAADGLASDFVRAIAITPDGTVWFETDGGISRYMPPR